MSEKQRILESFAEEMEAVHEEYRRIERERSDFMAKSVRGLEDCVGDVERALRLLEAQGLSPESNRLLMILREDSSRLNELAKGLQVFLAHLKARLPKE